MSTAPRFSSWMTKENAHANDTSQMLITTEELQKLKKALMQEIQTRRDTKKRHAPFPKVPQKKTEVS